MSNDGQHLGLRWTREPHEPCPYSDWTIEVYFQQEDGEAEKDAAVESLPTLPSLRYAVHRNMLGFGSMYFRRVFADCNKEFSEGTKKESKIGLPPPALEAFEVLLDFFYSLENNLTIRTSNAVGLFFLGDYLQIQTLMNKVQSFVKRDLRDSNCVFYFEQATELQIHCIRDLVAEFCCKNPNAISSKSALSTIADVDLWKAVLKYQREPNLGAHDWSSSLASFYWRRMWGDCRPRGGEIAMDRTAFQELTDPKLLPSISSDAALVLLSVEQVMQSDKCFGGPEDCDPFYEVDDEAKLTSLQERCVASLNDSWNIQCIESLQGKLRTYSPVVVESLFISVLNSVVNNEMKLKAEVERLSIENTALREHNTNLSEENAVMRSDIAKLNNLLR